MPIRSLLLSLFLILVLFAGSHPGYAQTARGEATAKISPELATQLAADEAVGFFVILSEQADVGAAASLPSKQEKGRYVFDTLRATSQRTQAGLLSTLAARHVTHRAFYIVNAIAVTGDAKLARDLAARPEVARLVLDPAVVQDRPVALPAAKASTDTAIEWGVADVHATDVWDLYAARGAGIVVASQDTGIRWDHSALLAHYRGWNGGEASHDYNWWDAIHASDQWSCTSVCGCDSAVPCDDHNHGTHTVGTMVGGDGGANQIGVAPGAQFIGCRNMHNGVGRPSTYAECFEFFLAPWDRAGENPDPAQAPHIVNNSWGCPPSEGCSEGTWGVIQIAEQNLLAAGVLIVASAGNSGWSGCESIDDPPAMFGESFAAGSYNVGHTIASSSSRGPRAVTGLQGPDVSAPGVDVRSALKNGGYGTMSGTSMAAPHVAGVAALLWSAVPELIGQVEITKQLLRETANYDVSNFSCGSGGLTAPWDTWDNVYGWGRIDALAAVEAARCLEDVDYSERVSVLDIALVAGLWGTSEGDAAYSPRRDLDFDHRITVIDIQRAAAAWPGSC